MIANGSATDIRYDVVKTQFPTEDVVIAGRVLAPPENPANDATPMIQAAIDTMAAAGGGVVFLRVGRYFLGRPLVVLEGVTLRGDRPLSPATGPVAGTILMPVSHRGNGRAAAAITLERGSGIRDLNIWYPDQDPRATVPYPWTISTSRRATGDNTTVVNVTIVNAYNAIRIGPEWNELHTLRNVSITALHTGIFIDTTTDIGRLIDVEIDPRIWEDSGLEGAPVAEEIRRALRRRLRTGTTGLDVGRSDWEFFYRVRVRGCETGIRFRRGEKGETNAVMFGCEFSETGTALRIDALNDIGLAAAACGFSGSRESVLAPESFSTVAQFNACEFRGPGEVAVRLLGRGLLSFQNCRFEGWTRTGVLAASGRLTLLDSDFAPGSVHVELGRDIQLARVLGNRFAGSPRIVNEATAADVEISHRPLECERLDPAPHRAAPMPRPATDRLAVVTDFGADPGSPDNTAAFQKALDDAGKAGGGTVYVPAGFYRFEGELVVPTGVELRGCFDVPHHTVSGGSVLLPTAGAGNADGTPFLRLNESAGLRGITVWYPDQRTDAVVPYPWTIQGLGPRCWLVDVTLGNAFRGVDFWTNRSDGHIVRYLAGAMLDRGLWVSKSDGDGWIEDVQMNPHYELRIHPSLPHAPRKRPAEALRTIVDVQRRELDGIVLGRCAREHMRGTFLYAAHDGLAFRDDDGGTNARVFLHGTDTGSRGAVFERVGDRGVDLILAQLVPHGDYVEGAILTTESFRGRVRFFNTQVWAGPLTARIRGDGGLLIQQMNTISGGIEILGGRCRIENVHFRHALSPHLRIGNDVRKVEILSCISSGGLGILDVENAAGERCRLLGNGASFPSEIIARGSAGKGPVSFALGFDDVDAFPEITQPARPGGGIGNVTDASCALLETPEAHGGAGVLRIRGAVADPASHAYVYFPVADGPFAVRSDSVLTYWIRPADSGGRHVGIDLLFTDGSTLRDSGVPGAHPSLERGAVGEWTRIRLPIGAKNAGRTVARVLCAFDRRPGGEAFEAWVDDVRLESRLAVGIDRRVTMIPDGGPVPPGTAVRLECPGAEGIRYTTDGSNPTGDSPLHAAPIALDRPGVVEIRAAPAAGDVVSPLVTARIFDVGESRD